MRELSEPKPWAVAWVALMALWGAAGLAACSGGVGTDESNPAITTNDDENNSSAVDEGATPGSSAPAEQTSAVPSSDSAPSSSTLSPPASGSTSTTAPSATSTAPSTASTAPSAASTDEPVPLDPTQAVVARLTQAELNNVLRDVLGDGSAPASVYLSEDEFSPYDNDATRQTVSSALVDSVAALADDVSQRIAHDSTTRSDWMPCEPSTVRDEACFDATVQKLARALFRRSIASAEIEPYRVLLDFAEEQGDFYVAVELLLSSLIQDPEFLYRLERGTADDPLQRNDHEIATRLAFLLWGSAPDEGLLQAADDGLLATSDGRRQAAARLLADPRAQRQLYRFHSMWLGYRAIPHDASLNAAFQMETEKLIERVVFDEPQNYLELFRSEQTYLNAQLSDHYGLPAPTGGEGWVTYPVDSGRAGILSHGSVLSGFSKFSDTSPTQRGIFVRTRLLCLDVPPPPPTVNVDLPPGGEAADGACKVERYRAHREQSGCADCHNLFEPIGQGLESFDRAGRLRQHDDDNDNCPIDAAGTLPGIGDFSGPAQLAQLLTDNNLIQDCFVRQYLQYSLAAGKLSSADLALAAQLSTTFEADGLKVGDWIIDFVSNAQFAQRAEATP